LTILTALDAEPESSFLSAAAAQAKRAVTGDKAALERADAIPAVAAAVVWALGSLRLRIATFGTGQAHAGAAEANNRLTTEITVWRILIFAGV
jgi:hypothetical protein